MPHMPPRACTRPACGGRVRAGVCDRCGNQRRRSARRLDDTRGSAHARGYGRRWRRIRDSVLHREPLCRACGAEGRTTAAVHVDHIVSKRRGGTDERSNLQPLCQPCHNRKTAKERTPDG